MRERTHKVPYPARPLQDLLLPEAAEGFAVLRCPLRDVVEEDISVFFPQAREWGQCRLAALPPVRVPRQVENALPLRPCCAPHLNKQNKRGKRP